MGLAKMDGWSDLDSCDFHDLVSGLRRHQYRHDDAEKNGTEDGCACD
jgi:hypothetical protein